MIRTVSDETPAIASFYQARSGWLDQAPCRGLACFVARGRNEKTWAEARSSDHPVYCLGGCYAAPVTGIRRDRPAAISVSDRTVLLANVIAGGARTLAAYIAAGGYRALKLALATPPASLLEAVAESGLRGRGGAGFPTGQKWAAVRAEAAKKKFVVANADEGDAGAFSDRILMEDDPFLLIEAMTLAGYAVGAEHGYIYLRAEYPAAAEILTQALGEAREAGLLGNDVLGSGVSFDLELTLGRGSYICGEETALLNSIEGRRPEVRQRPPWISTRGLHGAPTLMNNVETFAAVPWIVINGAAAYHALGHGRSRGTKLVSMNSLFRYPGLYEVEFGCTVGEIAEDIGGGLATGKVKGVIIGGPLAGVIPPRLFSTRFDHEALADIGASVGHGGVIGFDHSVSLHELAAEVFTFAAYESCGKCTPCRAGSARIARQLTGPRPVDGKAWSDIVAALDLTSYCGHGRSLAEFAHSLTRHYDDEMSACFA
jgi:formate dehydrogenase iron-sulfur subunit